MQSSGGGSKDIAESDKRARAMALKKGTDVMKQTCEANKAYEDWLDIGRQVDNEGNPQSTVE